MVEGGGKREGGLPFYLNTRHLLVSPWGQFNHLVHKHNNAKAEKERNGQGENIFAYDTVGVGP